MCYYFSDDKHRTDIGVFVERWFVQEFELEMVGDWYVQVGATPYVISEGQSDDLSVISQIIQSQKNQDLMLNLLSMATHYGCKVLVPSGHLNQ